MNTKTKLHHPVLLNEVIEGLVIQPEGIYVDATFGRGGHSQAILQRLNEKGRLLVIDKDPEAIAEARELFSQDPRVVIRQGSFTQLLESVEALGWKEKVNGILLDLGVSSPQLENPERGFSFLRAGPLEMRMDPSKGISAAEWINSAPEKELSQVFKEYGEERFAKRIAHAIVIARVATPITDTLQLAGIVANANPVKERKKHPATRVFQAIRIFINNELNELMQCLETVLAVLQCGGRFAVISFHSLEDRIVKQFIRKQAKGEMVPREIPIQVVFDPRLRMIGRAIQPSHEEIQINPRARSAVLRIAEKLR